MKVGDEEERRKSAGWDATTRKMKRKTKNWSQYRFKLYFNSRSRPMMMMIMMSTFNYKAISALA